jgi:hypothetical protein
LAKAPWESLLHRLFLSDDWFNHPGLPEGRIQLDPERANTVPKGKECHGCNS